MSIVAEFARIMHERNAGAVDRIVTPLSFSSRVERLYDVKAVIFDVYGTLVNYWRADFADTGRKEAALCAAFRHTADFFQCTDFLHRINPADAPERTLHDFYHGLIALNHEKSLKKGISFPEVRIEEVWRVIIMMLQRHGYDPSKLCLGEVRDVAQCAAYYYHFHALGRGFYPGIVAALRALKEKNITLGILSNGQFYTPVDLTLFIRDQSDNLFDDYKDLFENDLVFFSYEYGMAKPNRQLLRKLYDALYEYRILPAQTVFVGNDLSQDIQPACEAGMRTAFFIGDDKSAFVHDLSGTVTPDIVFQRFADLPGKLSFFQQPA